MLLFSFPSLVLVVVVDPRAPHKQTLSSLARFFVVGSLFLFTKKRPCKLQGHCNKNTTTGVFDSDDEIRKGLLFDEDRGGACHKTVFLLFAKET
jgi:hypothetical protein